jgi:hypothetical protein
MGKGLMRVSRSARRPLSIGTLLAAALLGSSIRADATPNRPHVLAAHRQSAAATEATLPTGFPGRPRGDLFHTEFDDGTLTRIQYFSGNQPPIVVVTAT